MPLISEDTTDLAELPELTRTQVIHIYIKGISQVNLQDFLEDDHLCG
jgi:hypothetical protein